MSGQVRFGVFADPHYAEMVYGDRYCEESFGKLGACIEVFERSELDFVVCMGDMIDAHEDPEVELGYLVKMREVFERFSGERHWVIGNHDVTGLAKDVFLEGSGSQGPYYSFDAGGFHFVILDGNCHEDGSDFSRGNFEWDQAWVSAAQLEWLADDLGASDGRQCIVFCHENVDWRLSDGERDPHVLCNALRVGAVLQQAGSVRAVFQAHYHPGIRTAVAGIECLGMRAMVVGSGMENNAFAIVTAQPGGSIVVEGFGQQPSCELQN